MPNTLTPWEWEQWYDEHGMPPKFVEPKAEKAEKQAKSGKGSWWQRLWRSW
ncbi:MAG: hypothetical protein ACPG1A_00915 [Halioglobus sp.]